MLPSAIRALMLDTISVRLKTSTGEDGGYGPVSATLGAAFDVRCRVSYRKSRAETQGGNEKMTDTVIHCDDIDGFGAGAQITLPDGSIHTVDSFRRPAWPDGSRHLEITL